MEITTGTQALGKIHTRQNYSNLVANTHCFLQETKEMGLVIKVSKIS